MLISAASAVASTTNGPISPTTLPPVVNRPTPMTVPAVMVMASRRPSVRLRPTAGSFCAPPSFGWLPMGVPFSVPTVLAGRRAVACPMPIVHATAPCGYDEITLALYRSKAIGILECEINGRRGGSRAQSAGATERKGLRKRGREAAGAARRPCEGAEGCAGAGGAEADGEGRVAGAGEASFDGCRRLARGAAGEARELGPGRRNAIRSRCGPFSIGPAVWRVCVLSPGFACGKFQTQSKVV